MAGAAANSGNNSTGNNSRNPDLQKPKYKSCKGCLYYSSHLNANQRNPVCVGIARALKQAVPSYIVDDPDAESLKDARMLTDFKYACAGYSVYSDKKNSAIQQQDQQPDLPLCVGIELLIDKRATTPVHQQTHRKEDMPVHPRPSTYRPPQPVADEFITRLYRNAGLVAGGVMKNARRVGNYVKECVDDIFYPYRRRPK